GKFEIAEHMSYGTTRDPRAQEVCQGRWKQYGNLPETEEEKQLYGKEDPNQPGQSTAQFGSYKFEAVCADFKPDIVCVPPGELVMTSQGYRNIEDIQVGDLVLTHRGRFRKVTKTMCRYHKGSIRKIKVAGHKEYIKLTPEHPVLIYRKRSQTNQKKSIKNIY